MHLKRNNCKSKYYTIETCKNTFLSSFIYYEYKSNVKDICLNFSMLNVGLFWNIITIYGLHDIHIVLNFTIDLIFMNSMSIFFPLLPLLKISDVLCIRVSVCMCSKKIRLIVLPCSIFFFFG